MIDNLVSFLAAASVALAVFGAGGAVVRLLALSAALRPLSRRAVAGPEGVAWSIGLGLVVCGAVLGMLAVVGLLRSDVLAALTLLAATWGLWQVFCAIEPIAPRAMWLGTRSSPDAKALASRSAHLRPIVPLACGLAVVGATLVAAMAPPISASALAGPVERSKTLLLDHGFATAETQTAAARTAGGAKAALGDLFLAWPMALDGVVAAGLVQWMLGLALALAVWALASPIVGARAATVSAALVLLQPQTWRSMTEPAGGLIFATFVVLASAAMWKAATEVHRRPWLYLAAAMAAAAAALESLAGGTFVALSHDGGSWVGSLLAHFGPLPLVALPAVLLCNELPGARWRLLTLAGACCCALFATGLWWALAPLAAIIAGWLWTRLELERTWPCRAAVGLLSALAIASAMPVVIGAAGDVPVALGLESREQYLARRLEGYSETMLAGLLVTPQGELISDRPARAYAACRTAASPSVAVASGEKRDSQAPPGRVTRRPGRTAR